MLWKTFVEGDVSDGKKYAEADSLPWTVLTNINSFLCQLYTFRAAIFDVPTTFPSLSFTSIPVNSSWFLISTTLQMLAVARRQGKKEKHFC